MKVDLCAVDEIPEEGTLEVPFFGRSLHVTKTDGRPIAYANACMHFGGPLAPDGNGVLQCAWHGARFDTRTGERIDGPAPRDSRLMRLSTVVEDGILKYVWAD
jgi:nitrite reductase/ring-hydroxylating ferredoxin subunit